MGRRNTSHAGTLRGLLVDQTFVETQRPVTPGVVVTQTAFDDQGQFSVNGQRADANYFTVGGVSANFCIRGALPALSAQSGTNSLVSIDAMQEFRVQTSSFAPEFGRTRGGQIRLHFLLSLFSNHR
jgi:hypothetical protein